MLLMTVMLTGCNADPTDTKTTVSAIQHLNVMDNVTISVSNEPITTQTEQIKLQFRNNSEQEVQYWEESFVPEKKMEDGFIVVGHYGTGHEISSVLETADEVNHKTFSSNRRRAERIASCLSRDTVGEIPTTPFTSR